MKIVALLSLASAHELRRNPVSKVVNLLRDLHTNLSADEAAEQKVFDKYACWCEATTSRKAAAVTDGKAKVAELTATILGAKAEIAQNAKEISERQKEIKENHTKQKEATELRQRENADFLQEKSEAESAIEVLNQSLKVLDAPASGHTQGALLSITPGVRKAFLLSKAALTTPQERAMRRFFAAPLEFYQTGYQPASATITGILKEMHSTFTTDLEAATKEEAQKQAAFEELITVDAKALAVLTKSVTKLQQKLASDNEELAAAVEERRATAGQVDEDNAFFTTTSEACKTKSEDWDTRKGLRQTEMEGITKAIELLDSDESRATFTTASFLQLPKGVFAHLMELASRRHLPRLSALVHRLRSKHKKFKAVLKEIDTLVESVKAEGDQDVVDRDRCIKETHENKMDHEEISYGVRTLKNKLAKLESKKSLTESQLEQLGKDILAQEKLIEDAAAVRAEDNKRYLASKADDEKAIELLKEATQFLQEAMPSFLEDSDVEPEFEVFEDQAPEAALSKDYKGRTGSHNGIVALLKTISEDYQRDIDRADQEEKLEEAAHEKAQKEAEKVLSDMKARKESKSEVLTSVSSDITDKEGDLGNKEGEKEAVETAMAEMKPGCDWVLKSFDQRHERRAEEIKGLLEAKSFLSGQLAAAQRGTFLRRH